MYTMVEMAKANDLNTYKYLTYRLSQRPDDKMSDEQLEQLAPWSETDVYKRQLLSQTSKFKERYLLLSVYLFLDIGPRISCSLSMVD